MSDGNRAVRAVELQAPRDVEALLDLLDHYARDPMGRNAPLRDSVRSELVEALRSEPGYRGSIAWEGDRPVGLVNCFRGFSTFAARPLLNVHDLVVRDDCRGRGIGLGLLAWAEACARELGCCKLTLEVLSGNTVAMRSYARAGFQPYQLDPAAGQALLLQKRL